MGHSRMMHARRTTRNVARNTIFKIIRPPSPRGTSEKSDHVKSEENLGFGFRARSVVALAAAGPQGLKQELKC